MTWSFPIGRLFGSELRVHATFLLLLAWIATSAWVAGGPEAALVNTGLVVAIFACVVAHEFGHALMARRFGIVTPDITLLPIGGMARLERMPEDPGQEVLVALAGPAVNVVIWLVLTLALGATTRLDALVALDDPAAGFLGRVASINLFLAAFNLIPAFPMDGGRVLRALLSIRLGRVRATRSAATAGQVVSFLFAFVGLTSGNLILVLIAIFIFMAAAAETSDVALRDRARGAFARDVMITTFETLAPDDTLDTAANAVVRTTQAEFPVKDPQGHVAGLLTRQAIIAGIERDGRMTPVARAMTTGIPEVGLRDPVDAVLGHLGDGAVPAVAVVDGNGAFIGYVTRENIGEWMALSVPARD
ncbi:CBS domain-containing protein [Rhodobacterales bacterium HKCCE2091]|nr:CBS domain-containing protein [Rhodobacterales bacterium HKCCE2091]